MRGDAARAGPASVNCDAGRAGETLSDGLAAPLRGAQRARIAQHERVRRVDRLGRAETDWRIRRDARQRTERTHCVSFSNATQSPTERTTYRLTAAVSCCAASTRGHAMGRPIPNAMTSQLGSRVNGVAMGGWGLRDSSRATHGMSIYETAHGRKNHENPGEISGGVYTGAPKTSPGQPRNRCRSPGRPQPAPRSSLSPSLPAWTQRRRADETRARRRHRPVRDVEGTAGRVACRSGAGGCRLAGEHRSCARCFRRVGGARHGPRPRWRGERRTVCRGDAQEPEVRLHRRAASRSTPRPHAPASSRLSRSSYRTRGRATSWCSSTPVMGRSA